jgi:DNA-binding HxlR family transcriptional regulator
MSVLGQRWAVLIVREALLGRTRFSEFRDELGIPSDVLSARLSELVAEDILEVVDYREPGARRRGRYELTAAGRELSSVLAAIGQWGHVHLARPDSSDYRFVETATGQRVGVAFRRRDGVDVPAGDVSLIRRGA